MIDNYTQKEPIVPHPTIRDLFHFSDMMHARPIRPHKTKELPNSFGLTGLAPVAWHSLHLSLHITSRMLFIFNLRNRG